MTDVEDLSPYYRRGPGRRSGRVRDFSTGQWIWGGSFGLVGILTLIFSQNPLGLVILLIAGGGAWRYNGGIGYHLPAKWAANRRTKYKAGRVGGTEEERAVFEQRPQDFLGVIGTMYAPDSKTDTAYFETDGFEPANEDTGSRYLADEQIAEALRTAIAQTDFDIFYGSIVGSRPQHPSAWANRVRDHYLHPVSLQAEEDTPLEYASRTPQEWLAAVNSGETSPAQLGMANINLVFTDMAEHGKQFYRTIFLTVERPLNWRTIAKHPERFTPADFQDSPLARMMDVFKEGLTAAGFLNVRIQTYPQVRDRVRQGLRVLTDSRKFELGLPLEQKDGDPIWSQKDADVVQGKYLRLDDSYFAVLVATRFGQEDYLPDGLDELLIGHPDYVIVTTHASTTSARIDQFFNRQIRSFNYARRVNKGALEEQADRDKASAEAQKVDDLHRSGSKAIRQNISFVIGADSIEVIKARVGQEEAKLRLAKVNHRQLSGQSLVEGFAAAMFGTPL